MADQSALQQVFSEYARALAHDYDIGDVLYRLTDHTVTLLDLDGAGVCIGDEQGDLHFVSATDDHIVQVELGQVQFAEGPCHQAYNDQVRISVPDLAQDQRWPRYSKVALEQGMRAVAGIPMGSDGRRIGAVNLYSKQARQWSADDLEMAQLLADMATGYVINARTLDDSRQLARQLQHALDSRVAIEQAKGILAERHGTDTAGGFQALRRQSRNTNTNIHDVAKAVVEGSLQPDPVS